MRISGSFWAGRDACFGSRRGKSLVWIENAVFWAEHHGGCVGEGWGGGWVVVGRSVERVCDMWGGVKGGQLGGKG